MTGSTPSGTRHCLLIQRAARLPSRVIARREAPWRSRPAGLDCRAPAGLAMTMIGEPRLGMIQ